MKRNNLVVAVDENTLTQPVNSQSMCEVGVYFCNLLQKGCSFHNSLHCTFQGLVNNVICLEFCKSSSHSEISDGNCIYHSLSDV